MGIALELLLFLFGVALLVFLITQVIMPLLTGTPFFPQIRKSTPLKEKVMEAERELEETTELVHLKEELKEINRRKAELEKE